MKYAIALYLSFLLLSAAQAQDRSAQITRILSTPTTRLQATNAPGIRFQLHGIYVLDGLIWFVATVSNRSPIDWRATPLRILIRDRHVWHRRARQELSLHILARHEPTIVHSDSTVTLCYAIAPRLPTQGQQLVLEYSERTGDRHLTLRVTGKQLLKAKKLGNESNAGIHPTTQLPPAPAPGG